MKKLIGIFKSEELALNTIESLKKAGYAPEEISVITKDEVKYDALKNRVDDEIIENPDGSSLAAGAATGGAIGGFGGLLLGLGALAIPGAGPIIAAGPIVGAITGALAGGAVGGVAGALIDAGVSEVEAREYEDHLNAGDILILVDEDDSRREAVYDSYYRNESLNREKFQREVTASDDVKRKDPLYPENKDHIVQEHTLDVEENNPYEAEKPYELDRNLRDTDQF